MLKADFDILKRITQTGVRLLEKDRAFEAQISTRYSALDRYQEETWRSLSSLSDLEPNKDSIWPHYVPKARMKWLAIELAMLEIIDNLRVSQKLNQFKLVESFNIALNRNLI